MTGITCRNAVLPDVERMLDWAAQEGWNPGLDDAATFYAADPEGFFIAEREGVPVAAISVVNHTDSYAFLGLYLCRPEHRGQGIGLRLWQHALAHAGSRVVGLDGVPDQEANYVKSGFVLADRTRRLTGVLPEDTPPLPLARRKGLETLCHLDRAATGVDRDRFLRAWLENGPTRKTVLLREAGVVTGFATARLCRDLCKVGPIISPDAPSALHLAAQAAALIGTRAVSIDVPDSSAEFGALLRSHGFEDSFATARMYRGGTGPQGDGTLQAVASLELG